MELTIGKLCGFCAGVNYTINKTIEILEKEKNIYCLGEIIHNERVIKRLEDMGMITVNSLDDIPPHSKVIFRAHGEAKHVYEEAKKKELEIIDLTCGKVRLIHTKVEQADDSFVIIIGKKSHPETIGTLGYAKNSYVIESDEDFNNLQDAYNNSKLNKVYVVAQTTFNDLLFAEYVDKIKELLDTEIIVDNTICAATRNRQEEVLEMSKNVDKMIIIGGKHSSNTKELATVAEKNCQNIYLVQELADLKDVEFNENDKIGITAGASTPGESIDEIVSYLKENYNAKEA